MQGAESEHSNDECKRNKKKKTRKRRTSRVTTLKNVRTTRTTATTVATVAGTIPRQASAIRPYRATGKSRTSRVPTRSPTRIITSSTILKGGRSPRKTVLVFRQKNQKHLWSLIRESQRSPRRFAHQNQMAILIYMTPTTSRKIVSVLQR